MIGGEEHLDLVASWGAERRWFKWTVGFAAGLSVGVVGWLGLSYWAFLKFQEITRTIAATGSADVAAMDSLMAEVASSASPVQWLGMAIQLLVAVSGLGFLLSLVKWLLAIRHRRAIHGGALPRSGR